MAARRDRAWSQAQRDPRQPALRGNFGLARQNSSLADNPVCLDCGVRSGVGVARAERLPEPAAAVFWQGIGVGDPDAPQVLGLEPQRAAAHPDAVRLNEQLGYAR